MSTQARLAHDLTDSVDHIAQTNEVTYSCGALFSQILFRGSVRNRTRNGLGFSS